MRAKDLFHQTLDLTLQWQVSSSKFELEQKRLDTQIDFARSSTLTFPECDQSDLKAHDTQQKSWRHLNFFKHDAYLTTRVARVHYDKFGIRLVAVPWARSGSGFTLLFEVIIMTLTKAMPVNAGHSQVRDVGMDETSNKIGHNNVSVFVNFKQFKVLYATEGKDASTVKRFKQDLSQHVGDPNAIEEMCCDMSPAIIKGVGKHFPNSRLTFDNFHITKIINEAVDQVRHEVQKKRSELSHSPHTWLKNPKNLKPSQAQTTQALTVKEPQPENQPSLPYQDQFQELYNQPAQKTEALLKKRYFWTTHSRLESIKEAAYTIKRHWNGVLRWFTSNVSNGILEGLNSLIQAAKARARGYRTTRNLLAIIYLIGAKLEFGFPN